ncbi:hypothetical protein GGTG_07401 [Gaeumannomyces tritici R3-111a-1]|uniref:Prolyl 4-hydroxylase alpha subunit domain-containing protein n=1 Tax=Gaeumannomyces tritici (strain R3-111a-1) TaxID=644352 RepID=J3P1K3_GAET3|nr:hypothetical protein GGTG_07401 [Gaeumannomyces tritici R3-111a-1]EJT73545.1 hypothetical protein GGTG_07401 [Gaeumannomyces tritici R3-111a-1]
MATIGTTLPSVLAGCAVLLAGIAYLDPGLALVDMFREQTGWLRAKATSSSHFTCLPHAYTTELVSVDPLVIYIRNFTTSAEAASIMATGTPHLVSSPIVVRGADASGAPSRTSHSAPLDPTDPAVACVLARARSFMGGVLPPPQDDNNEAGSGGPQMVRYNSTGSRFDLHTDWFARPRVLPADAAAGRRRMYNRAATFFAVLECRNCSARDAAGETWFPRVEPVAVSKRAGEDGAWRRHQDGGVAFAPAAGNAVFWVNLFPANGSGDARVVHAGLPVAEGSVKTAMNIWPRVFFGPDA